jgi:formylglycine-generating enzyme required for sulfatase activity
VANSPNTLPNNLTLHRYKRSNKSYTEDLGDGVKLTLMLIPEGEFMMGAPADEPESKDSERPQHRVEVAQFLMGRYPVTQAQWRIVAGYEQINRELDPDPANFKGDNRPVERVNWHDAQEFCKRLSKETGKDYRLPSEAQWEYACRAGTDTPFNFGEIITPQLANYDTKASYSSFNEIKRIKLKKRFEVLIKQYENLSDQIIHTTNNADRIALEEQLKEIEQSASSVEQELSELPEPNFLIPQETPEPVDFEQVHDHTSNTQNATTNVGSFPANDWGLYDMHGNVYEWCGDDWHENYEGVPDDGSAWVENRSQNRKLLRGGSWYDNPGYSRSAFRNGLNQRNRYHDVGFRVCCVPPRILLT